MTSNRSLLALAAWLWVVGGAMLTLGMTLRHWRVGWERENVVTTLGLYECGKYSGLINNYVYTDEGGDLHSQGFPLWGAPAESPFAVQYLRRDPANGWIKRGGPSTPLLLLYGVHVVAVALLLGGAWLASRETALHARRSARQAVRGRKVTSSFGYRDLEPLSR